MDNEEEFYVGVPVQMVAQLLRNPQDVDAARVTVVIDAANRRIDDLRKFIAEDAKAVDDPFSADINSAEHTLANSTIEKIELQKLERAIPLLETLRDEKLEAEDHASKIAAREKAATEYETCLRKFLAFAPMLAKIAGAHAAYLAAHRAAVATHNALPDSEPLIEIGNNHTGVTATLVETLEKAAKAMTEAADKREQLDEASRQYRADAPERFRREQTERNAGKAGFDAGEFAKFNLGLGAIGSTAAFQAAHRFVMGGGSYADAMKAGEEAALAAVENAKAKAA